MQQKNAALHPAYVCRRRSHFLLRCKVDSRGECAQNVSPIAVPKIKIYPSLSPAPGFSGALMLCVLTMMNHVVLTGGRITVSLTALKMGLSTIEVGWLVAVFAILPMLLSIRTGRWIDQIGTFRPLAIGGALTTIGASLPFIFPSQITLLVAACSIGIGFMLVQVATQNLLGQADPAKRLRNFSWLSLTLAGSGFAGPLFAGLAIDHLGDRYAFGLLTIPPLIALLVIHYVRHILRAADAPTGAKPEKRRRVMELAAIPPLRRVLGVNTMLSGAWDTHLFVVPLYGVTIGLSATTIGIILAAFSSATFAIRLVLPFILRHVRSWTLVRVAIGTAVVVFVVYPWFRDLRVLIALSFVLGLALGSCQPSMLALLHQHSPPGRAAEAVGLRMALINTSQVSLPLAFGALGTVIGVAPLFWAYAYTLVAGGVLCRNPPAESSSDTA